MHDNQVTPIRCAVYDPFCQTESELSEKDRTKMTGLGFTEFFIMVASQQRYPHAYAVQLN
jgi:hypothetical protein